MTEEILSLEDFLKLGLLRLPRTLSQLEQQNLLDRNFFKVLNQLATEKATLFAKPAVDAVSITIAKTINDNVNRVLMLSEITAAKNYAKELHHVCEQILSDRFVLNTYVNPHDLIQSIAVTEANVDKVVSYFHAKVSRVYTRDDNVQYSAWVDGNDGEDRELIFGVGDILVNFHNHGIDPASSDWLVYSAEEWRQTKQYLTQLDLRTEID